MLGLGLPTEVCPDASLGALEMEMYRVFGSVFLGPIPLRVWGAQDWAEGELESWCCQDRG